VDQVQWWRWKLWRWWRRKNRCSIGQYGGTTGYDSSANQSGREPSYGGGNDGGYVDRIQRISSGVEPGYTPTSSQPFGVSPEQAYNEGKITVDQYREAQQVQDNAALNQPNLLEKLLIYINNME
jgi:hypothetical protein